MILIFVGRAPEMMSPNPPVRIIGVNIGFDSEIFDNRRDTVTSLFPLPPAKSAAGEIPGNDEPRRVAGTATCDTVPFPASSELTAQY